MDDSQITGTASSYARKYALNGLFCIDDTKDADSVDGSVPTENDRAWIDAVKQNPGEINRIDDPVYRMRIELFVKEGK